MNIIEIEQQFGYLRNQLPSNADFDPIRRNICDAQNTLQKYIEKTIHISYWKHVKTMAPKQTFDINLGDTKEGGD